ncbi:MAG: carbonic anhydrase [bacterium]
MKLKQRLLAVSGFIAGLLFFACESTEPTGATVESELNALASQGSSLQSLNTEWGYKKDNGPEKWCVLDPAFTLCCEDREQASQTPVDIKSKKVKRAKLPKLQFNYTKHTELEVEHNGHTIEAKVPAGDGTLAIGEKSYGLVQFHWHHQSEHAIDGRLLPMEMHLVHRAGDGSLAVVGVFIVTGREHDELDEIWDDLPKHQGEQRVVHDFSLRKLLPEKRATVRYSGSLTTPPCSEGVSWNVFIKPITMSRPQIREFEKIFSGKEFPHGNRRPLQDLNGRRLLTDYRDLE